MATRIAMLGCGHVGLVTGACLAEHGHRLEMIDVDADRIALLRRGGLPFHEPGLAELVAEHRGAGRLRFGTDMAAVAGCSIVFFAVPTPSRDDGSADTSFLRAAAEQVAPHLDDSTVIVVRSTVPPGTTDALQTLLGPDRLVAHVPEFLREGSAVRDGRHPERIVIGTRHARARDVLAALYTPFLDERPLVVVDPRTAELGKYAANTYLATRIAFIDAIADMADAMQADVEGVREILGTDPRIGAHYLHPGPGYGGACLPKDVQALAASSRAAGQPAPLIEAVHASNVAHRASIVLRIRDAVGDGRLCLWGLAFKAFSDDCRESVACDVLTAVPNATITAYDPEVTPQSLGADIAFAASPLEAAAQADVVAVLTEWPVFGDVPLTELAAVMRGRTVIDARNALDPDEARAAGLDYQGVGRR